MPTEELKKALTILAMNCKTHVLCDWCEFYDKHGQTNCKLHQTDPELYDELLEE